MSAQNIFSQQQVNNVTQSAGGYSIECHGPLVMDYDASRNYLTDPRKVRKLWKGPDSYVSFGPYRSRVMIRGSETGVPVCYLKGGPGSAPVSSAQKRYWQPDSMRIALSSWRGCGDSTPLGGTEQNTTNDLLEDVETMRRMMGVEAMVLAGYCWGGTVAFKYAERYPERVLGAAIMLPYLAREIDVEQGFGPTGIAKKYPGAYEEFCTWTGSTNPRDIFSKYAAALNQDLRSREAVEAYTRWVNWEYASSGEDTRLDAASINPDSKQELWAIAGERINVSYLSQGYFLPSDGVTQNLHAVNSLAEQGKPILYISNELDPLMAPDHLQTLQKNLPAANSMIIRGADWHWTSPKSVGKSNALVENGLAFMVQRAVYQIQRMAL